MAAAVTVALVVVASIAHLPAPASPSIPERTNTTELQPSTASQVSGGSQPVNRVVPPRAVTVKAAAHASRSPFKRVEVNLNEVDYVASDVIVRHFGPKTSAPQSHVGQKEVKIGHDVTIRYFGNKPGQSK